jgi:hypothetical protein
VTIGVADLTLDPVLVSLATGPVAVLGGPGSGRTTALALLAAQLRRTGCIVWVFGPAGSPLALHGDPRRRAVGPPGEVASGLDALVAEHEAGPASPVAALIDDLDLLDDPAFNRAATGLLTAGPSWAASTATIRGYTTSPLVQELRRARTVLHLQPASGREVHEHSGVHPRIRPGLSFPPGRGVVVASRRPVVVQLAWPEPDTPTPAANDDRGGRHGGLDRDRPGQEHR